MKRHIVHPRGVVSEGQDALEKSGQKEGYEDGERMTFPAPGDVQRAKSNRPGKDHNDKVTSVLLPVKDVTKEGAMMKRGGPMCLGDKIYAMHQARLQHSG